MENCNCHHEISLAGSGQLERYLKALDPAYVSIDGRSIEDLLVYAAGYADQIRFYDMPGSTAPVVGPAAKISWAEFFKRDMAVIASSIAMVDLVQIKNDYDTIGSRALLTPTMDLYGALFDQIVAIIEKIDQWYSVAIPENPLYGDIDLAINSTLRAQLKKMIAYEKGAIFIDSKTTLNIDYTKVLNQQEWGLNDPVDPDSNIYDGTTAAERITGALPYIGDIFHAFYGVLGNIVARSDSYLSSALKQYPSHQPHMALFITFLQLFNMAQQQMNGITARMLDFYYHEVLRLAKKPALPDKVFVIFQLAQNVTEYDLAKGTALSAGKDASGKEQVYKTEDDFVINQAAVKELKNVFISQTPPSQTNGNTDTIINSIYANNVANSMDGNGAKFTVPNPKWSTFGIITPAAALPNNICEYINQKQAALDPNNVAAFGFAIASPQLVLQGGNRLIKCMIPTFKTLFSNRIDATKIIGGIQISLTGKNGWIPITNVLNKTDQAKVGKVLSEGAFDPSLTDKGYFVDNDGNLFIFLPVSEDGVVAFDPKLHKGYNYTTAYPVMEVILPAEMDMAAAIFNTASIYTTDAKNTVHGVSISVQVGSINNAPKSAANINKDGLKTLIIKNNTPGIIKTGKLFDPFTTLPARGMSFYIGSEEVFNKPFDDYSTDVGAKRDPTASQLTVNINKLQNPDTINVVGAAQPKAFVSFDYDVSVLTNRNWIELCTSGGSAFTQETLTLDILNQDIFPPGSDKVVVSFALPRKPIEFFTDLDEDSDKGFLRLDNVSLGLDMDIQERLKISPSLQIKDISVNYRSNLLALDPAIDQVFHIYPFGVAETYYSEPISRVRGNTSAATPHLMARFGSQVKNPLAIDAKNALLPQFTFLSPIAGYKADVSDKPPAPIDFKRSDQYTGDNILDHLIYDSSSITDTLIGGNNQYSGTVQEEGMLYIGVEKLQPLQTLSLLFEFAEGSAIDNDNDPPKINWSYLSYNAWLPLKAENIIHDSTYGFQTTGIVKIDVPGNINDNHTIITNGLYWFCASVTSNSNRIPELIAVIAQATEVQFFDQGNSPSHYVNALPAGTISKLSVATSSISKVTQPFASFDGKHAEVGKEYYTRVSERLRHKHRAITSWDYEHLVLDQFPQVFKVKCIPNTDSACLCRTPTSIGVPPPPSGKTQCCGPVPATGNVLIVPVPNLKNDNSINLLQPKTSRLTLIEIKNYLTPLTSPFVTVHARNPVYEQVIVFFSVKFMFDVDKGYYLKKLNDEIVQYLTPWAFDPTIEADFDKKIYASAIITFIEKRPYVDFITDFLMGVCRDECCPPVKAAYPTPTQDSFITALDKISGCNDIEDFLKQQSYFVGDVIAEPSTPMSLLVSAPHHIILLYEDPVELTPCEKRNMTLLKGTTGVVTQGSKNLGGAMIPKVAKPAAPAAAQSKAVATAASVTDGTKRVVSAIKAAAATSDTEKLPPVVAVPIAAPDTAKTPRTVEPAAGNTGKILRSQKSSPAVKAKAEVKPEDKNKPAASDTGNAKAAGNPTGDKTKTDKK